jgi:predicted RNase H-like HicB family nuclease
MKALQKVSQYMQYLVILEKHDGAYTATVPALPGCCSQGVSEEEALHNIRAAIAETLARVTITTVEVEETPKEVAIQSKEDSVHTWAKYAGMWKDDPSFDDFLAQIEADRRQLESENSSG